jgi:FkbM family methyltransferase
MASADTPSARHPVLRALVRMVCRLPGAQVALRVGTRVVLQRNWLSLRNKQRLYNLIAPELISHAPLRFDVRVTGGRAPIHVELELGESINRLWYYFGYSGGYEPELTAFMKQILPNKCCFIDVGANTGYYTLLAASLLPDGGNVHSFEAHPQVVEQLRRNLTLTGFANVVLNAAAVCDADQPVELYLPRPSDTGWAAHTDRHLTNASLVPGFTAQDQVVEVRGVRLDTYCREFGLTDVDLIKVDVEGAELRVLNGMRAVLTAMAPDLILEILEPYADALDAFFANTRYRKFLIGPDGLEERRRLAAMPQLRNYYLTVAPMTNN